VSRADDIPWLLSEMLPGGGYAVTVSAVYIDESIEQVGDPILCVAGYVFRKSKAQEFSRVWGGYLKRKGLPYFHMTDCALKEGVFKGRDDCDEIARELIRLTKKYTSFGFAVSLDMRDYDELIGQQEGMRTAYAFALLAGMQHVRRWRERTSTTGPSAFFFEAGHEHQSDANVWLTWMLGSQVLRDGIGYQGVHAFIPKVNPALHPADYLSWHWRLETVRSREPRRSRGRRADLDALWRPTDMLAQYTRPRLTELKEEIERRAHERAEIIRQAIESGVVPPPRSGI
jgi:hypothetical protein